MPPTPATIRARAETDLDDATLQAIIDDAATEITDRYGPYRSGNTSITVTIEGRKRMLSPWRPIDTAQSIAITEYVTADPADVAFAAYSDEWWPNVGEVTTVLASNDFRVWHAGRTIERLFTGTHPRVFWGARADLTYVPVDDTKRRDEVVVKLVILGLAYQGVVERKVGDVQTIFGLRSASGGGSPLVYADERERLLSSLQPRRALMLR